jgi:hypothetical protein
MLPDRSNMSKLIRYWEPVMGIVISMEEWGKAGFRVSQYPAHIKDLALGTKKK